MKGAIAIYENRQRLERTRRGKLGRVKADYPLVTAGRAPFGYTYISEPHKGRLVVNDEEAAIVRLMYHWLTVERLSSYAITQRLWEMGVPTRSDDSESITKKSPRGDWSPSTIRRILGNPLYKGEYYYGKTRRVKRNGQVCYTKLAPDQWVMVPVEPIIDPETWQDAQRCLAENQARAKRNMKREYLLSGLIFCPCGRRWVARYKSNVGRAHYSCPTAPAQRWQIACPNRFSIRQEILETAVWNQVTAFLLDPDTLLTEVARQRTSHAVETERRTQRLASIDAAIADVDRKLGQLLTRELAGYPQAVIDREKEALLTRRRDLEAEQSRLLAERAEQEISADLEAMLRELADTVRVALPAMMFAEKRRILELLRIRVDVIDRETVRLSGIITGSVMALALGLPPSSR